MFCDKTAQSVPPNTNSDIPGQTFLKRNHQKYVVRDKRVSLAFDTCNAWSAVLAEAMALTYAEDGPMPDECIGVPYASILYAPWGFEVPPCFFLPPRPEDVPYPWFHPPPAIEVPDTYLGYCMGYDDDDDDNVDLQMDLS